jgi:hypothetical protein
LGIGTRKTIHSGNELCFVIGKDPSSGVIIGLGKAHVTVIHKY